ncbi:MAG: leucine-rich repeat domain-containing protein [Alloprevotella sp.]|nr:leucine-rich repeat domain-containing protein [Alloprevotella sp.]
MATIEISAFRDCTSLTSISIPSSVTSIGVGAFAGCTSLSNIVVNKNNPVYDSRDNCNAIIETASDKLIIGCKNTYIPNTVTTIAHHAFVYISGQTSIVIPNSVSTIEGMAFYAYDGLTSVTIPASVTNIGAGAFFQCYDIKDIYALRVSPADYNAVKNSFYEVDLSACTLHVPAGCEAFYRACAPWSLFGNIVDDIPTGVQAPSMVNGQWSMTYDLLGRRAVQPARGIYVQKDGRKLIR